MLFSGLMAGANMSGELARPSVSIPRGTVQAVVATLVVYILTAFLTAGSCSRYLLQSDYAVINSDNCVVKLFFLAAKFQCS